jgi:hypothetical protein
MSYVEPYPPRADRFEGEFKRDGDAWLYRVSARAPAIRITEAERRGLLYAKSRQADRSLMIALVAGMALVMVSMLFLREPNLRWSSLLGGAAVIAGIILADAWRSRKAAHRAFAGRPEAAPARSRREVDDILVGQTSWWDIAIQAVVLTFWTWRAVADMRPWPAAAAMTGLGLFALLLCARRAARGAQAAA